MIVIAGSMGEILALEDEIMAALPRVASFPDADARYVERDAQELLFNAWNGPGARLDRLRQVADEMRRLIHK